MPESNIPLTLIYEGEHHQITTYVNEYSSLMALISNRLPVLGFGLCCGMGSCGTCMVIIGSKYTTITRPVLACDIRDDDGLANTQITIPEQRY
jgi:aerobic-type carbon monoxide dehydrogenase small subunit (CoxS/CutS family)